MRTTILSLTLFLTVFSYSAYANAQVSSPTIFTANLSLGSSGEQVMALQRFLNQDPDTRIANIGTGSPGYETNYFGSLTKTAVVRFQEKYASEILTPAGLVRGNGYVGFYTRTKISALLNPPIVQSDSTPSTYVAPVTQTPPPTVLTTTPINPNLKNLDKLLIALEDVAKKQGSSAADIATIKKEILKVTATTTDLQAAFEEIVRKQSNQSAKNDSFFDRVLSIVNQALEKTFLPTHALAAIGVPFGGALLAAIPCFCSATWLLYISPLPPSFAAVLTYIPGSQAFLSYNIPATSWLLGDHIPGAGVCLIPGTPCWYIPSEGMITPTVGSSPL